MRGGQPRSCDSSLSGSSTAAFIRYSDCRRAAIAAVCARVGRMALLQRRSVGKGNQRRCSGEACVSVLGGYHELGTSTLFASCISPRAHRRTWVREEGVVGVVLPCAARNDASATAAADAIATVAGPGAVDRKVLRVGGGCVGLRAGPAQAPAPLRLRLWHWLRPHVRDGVERRPGRGTRLTNADPRGTL